MKLKDVVFRKMNILYVFILLLMFIAIISIYEDYSYKRAYLEEETRGIYLSVTFDKEQKDIKGVSEMTRIKTAPRIMKVDSSLTGNYCKTVDTAINVNEGTKAYLTFGQNPITCEVVDKVKAIEMYPYEVYVSQETYDSINQEGYTYLLKVDDYNTFKKIYWGKDEAFIPLSVDKTFNIVFSLYYATVITLNILAVILLLLIVVIYFNTLKFIKTNTKKTKKETKDHIVLNAAISTCATIAVSVGIILLIAIIVPIIL